MTAHVRHQPGSSRAPVRGKPVQRGASRLVIKEPMSLRVNLPKTNFSWLRRLTWPLLLLGLGYGTYELSLRALPYADQPIATISVEGDLSYVNQQAVQARAYALPRRASRRAWIHGVRVPHLDRQNETSGSLRRLRSS